MRILFVFLLIITLNCCSYKREGNSVDLDKINEVSIFDIVDSVNVVQLETNQQSLIGNLSRVIIWDKRYYIYDYLNHSIFCFDEKGKYLFKINKRGRGPDEYQYLEFFTIDRIHNQLILLVPFGEVLYFDKDGNFINKVKLPEGIKGYNEVHVLNEDTLIFASLSSSQILYYSKKNNRIFKEIYPRKDTPRPFNSLDRTYLFEDSLYFSHPFSNGVINLSNENQKQVFTWNFGSNNNSIKMINKLKKFLIERENSKERILFKDLIGEGKYLKYFIITNNETSRFRTSIIDYKNDFLCVFYDKKLKRDYVFRNTKEGIRLLFPYLYDESIIMHENSSPQNKDYSFYSKDILSPEQLKIVEANNTEQDNPFLVIYKLKK